MKKVSGTKVKRLRKKTGLTQVEAAKLANLSRRGYQLNEVEGMEKLRFESFERACQGYKDG